VRQVSDVELCFLSQRTEGCPLGAVGLIYDDPDEVPGLLREMINNNDHYRRTARKFAGAWFGVHNAHHLVTELTGTAHRSTSHIHDAVQEPYAERLSPEVIQ